MVTLITGNGKGKTTSSIGQSIRALGRKRKVFFVQFIKSDGYPSGEDAVLRGFGDRLVYVKGGRGFVGILGDKLPFEEHKAAAEHTFSLVTEAAHSGEYGLLVLDEINVAIALKLIPLDAVFSFLDSISPECDVVLTGRYADPALIERADLVTECREVKHPFQIKTPAQKGIEY